MTKHFARPAMRLAVVMVLALGAAGCETVADLDPTGLLSDDTAPLPADNASAAPTAAADTDVTTPDLAALPPRPAAPDASQQAQAAQQVAAAGAQAQYSADALRAGTEAAAPPPVPVSGVPAADLDAPPTAGSAVTAGAAPAAAAPAANGPAASALMAGTAPSSQASEDAPPTAEAAPPTANPVATPAVASAVPPAPPSAEAPPVAEPAAPPSTAAPAASAPAAAPSPVTTASLTPPPGAEPAVPAVPPGGARGALASAAPSDAALGFKRSEAPPLNPSISQWVSGPILAHYRQTASLAGTAGTSPAVGDANAAGDVVANLNAAPGTPAGMIAAMNGGVPPTEIIYFAGDGTALSAKARRQIDDAVAAFKANGGTGSIKVVGHASSRTADMSLERHLEAIFRKSQQRADAVAQALIKAGIPASKVVVQAVGDSQPVYYESMPKGEQGNRRAEIFLQG